MDRHNHFDDMISILSHPDCPGCRESVDRGLRGNTEPEPRHDPIVLVMESVGRMIVGTVHDTTEFPLTIMDPLAFIEQPQPGGNVATAMMPLILSMPVDAVLVPAPSSVIEVPRDSRIAKMYLREIEKITMMQRAAQSGIVMAGANDLPNPGNGGPIAQTR